MTQDKGLGTLVQNPALPFSSWMTLRNLTVTNISFLLWKYTSVCLTGKIWVLDMIIYIKALYISSPWEKCKLLILMPCCYYIFVDYWRIIICHMFQMGQSISSVLIACELNFIIWDIWSYLSSVLIFLVCLYSSCQGDDKLVDFEGSK